MKQNRVFYAVSFLALVLFTLLEVLDPQLIRDHVESKSYDLRLHLRDRLLPQPLVKEIAIVAIDEASVAAIGRWPWSRHEQARLLRKVSEGKPKAVGVDIMLSERENPGADADFGRAVKEAGNVVLATLFMEKEKGQPARQKAAPDFLWDSAFMEVKSVPGIAWKQLAVHTDQVNPPVDEIGRSGVLGSVTTHPDMDGVLRREALSVNYGDDCYPSMPLQVARIALGIPMKEMILQGGSGVQLGSRFIPTDLNGRAIINYRGPEHSFPHLSAADLMQGRLAPSLLRDKIVLIGTSALATYDQKVSPLSADLTGVEKNANVVQNIILNNFIRKCPMVLDAAMMVAACLILIVFLPRLSARRGVAAGFGVILCYALLSFYLLAYREIWVNLVYPGVAMTVILTAGSISRLFMEEASARRIRAMFSSYVTERLVDEMIRNPEMARLGGEKREVTVLFSDVKGFTSYSESHEPEEVVAILNEYLGAMTEVILAWDGILDKFIGDAIVVFWGAPMLQEDHARRAVGCALAMQERLAELRRKWEAEGRAPLDSGIGINTGEAIVGNIGAEGKKMDYTVIGDHVNLGARVEGLTRRYETPILMTEYTVAKLRGEIAAGSLTGVSITGLERVIVKGKDTPVGMYSVAPLAAGERAVFTDCDPEKVVRLTEK
ncbi:CHASE2 domain-containing protein [Geomesophilobacter sediminis]|uniref:Adenylate/guanylate cyclase domain-containing protein n=1 Tax=Geomesophilobacter sediminis TaxID=2798584 RepID=A0A8J7JD53_9BACT|nr:adenylate/guanylate cyclase domain-containing protein [Geomesophilobacter sediminis]MBJ6724958.1 adenylate/guanylate cyclase domain-containing protein [Geomesophilobacter sediminis]